MKDPNSIYILGQYRAYNQVLFYLNTLEYKLVDKTEIYKDVFNMKPEKLSLIEENDMNKSDINEYLEQKTQDINKICNDVTTLLQNKKFRVGSGDIYTL